MRVAEPDYLPGLMSELNGLDHPASVARLEAAAREHPFDARPLLLLGGEEASAGAYDKAEAAYLAALHRAPDFAIVRFQLGLLQLTGGRPAEALMTWAPLEQLPQEHYLRIFAQGLAELIQDHFDDAIRLLQEGMARNTENAPLNQDMAGVIERTRQVQAQNASGETSHVLLSGYRDQV